ncbi:MAG: bifunctional acetate--CoA ligase family protein/GNAT family N-acetyltransferase [Promethearchaeota archaeon]
MVTTNLARIFNPQSIALIGASEEEESVGQILMHNLTQTGYLGKIYPVNNKREKIMGFKAYTKIGEIEEPVDLAIIATPAKTVAGIVEECGEAGIPGVIIISAGFREIGKKGREREAKLKTLQKKYNLRIIGPNCLGIIRPNINLNATFTETQPNVGNIAFISQSGALGSAILDLAVSQKIGFSAFVSVGSMIDVDFGDLIDYFGTDQHTRSIIMYIEGITDARKFMSAARHFAKTKPVIVVKAGKFSESAKAAASHTGSLAGSDLVYDAAFKRAGIVRVEEISDLFNAAEVLGIQPLPQGPRLAIITNAGGPGVMSADALIARGGKLAKLSDSTIEGLDAILPPYWSHGNPVDLLGDADAERYRAVMDLCLADPGVDGILIIYTPQATATASEIARSIVGMCDARGGCKKTILTSFMGAEKVDEANKIFIENGYPTYWTPEQAIATFMHMYQYERNLELLYETPEELPIESAPPKRPVTVLIRNASKEKREILTEVEAKQLLEFYNIPVAKTRIAKTVDEAASAAASIGFPVVLKIHSPDISHKSDAGGVKLDLKNDNEVRDAYNEIIESVKAHNPKAKIQGVSVQRMINPIGTEVILGAKRDPLFGPVIMFGMGGIGVEFFNDVSLGFPPLNQTLARRIMEDTRVYRILKKGYRRVPPANLKMLEELIVRFSQMIVDFPEIKEMDINPLLIDDKQATSLDARVVIDLKRVGKKVESLEELVISPYPKRYEQIWCMRDGRSVLLRPIKPEDEPLWLEMFQNFSEESIRYRFFEIIKDTPHEVRIRYTNIDYDREIAIVPVLREDSRDRILGVVRLIEEPNGKRGEIAFIVADPWQGLGLGSKMIDYMIEICIDRGLEEIYGVMLPDNYRAHRLMEKMGFTLKRTEEGLVEANLDLNAERQWRTSKEFSPAPEDILMETSDAVKSKKSKKKQRKTAKKSEAS